MLISLRSIDYSIGGQALLLDASMVVNEGEKIAIIGRNGSGKSTLLNLLQGELALDAGTRDVAKKCRILLVKQNLPEGDISPIEYLKELDEELQALYDQLDAIDASAVGDVYEVIEEIERTRYEIAAPNVLMGLGIDKEQQERPMRELSGGLRMRVGLASALLQQPDVLLLDEPTNHLDLPSSIWLTEYLKRYSKAFVLVSHDRALLDAVINTTYQLSQGKLSRYQGNFSTYVALSDLEREHAVLNNKNADKRISEIQSFVDTHKSNPKWARICRTREGWIEDLDAGRLELTREAPPIPIEFPQCAELRDPVVQARHCSVGYTDKTILTNVDISIQTRSRIGILGRNGEGKSTLMRMLVQQGMVTTTGELTEAMRLRVGYYSQEQTDTLSPELTVLEQARCGLPSTATTDDVLTYLLRFGFKREHASTLVRDLSGGEKTRLSFAMIAACQPHLIVMDEPTNHLDFETREKLIEAIKEYNGAVVLVSHDWELLNQTMNTFWLVRNGAVQPYTHDLNFYRAKILERTFTGTETGVKVAAKKETAEGVKKSSMASAKGTSASASRDTIFNLGKKAAKSDGLLVKVKNTKEKVPASAPSFQYRG